LIPYNRQSIDQQDIDSVVEVLNSPLLTQGRHITEFENLLKQYCSAPYALAVSSGTAALHLACMALGVKSGDKVWTSSNSFVASANCARYCDADVDFVDIDLNTGCICPQSLREKLENTEKSDLPSLIVVVDYAGHSADYKAISELAQEFNFKIIQDASHSFGASYKDEKVGAAHYVDAVTLSFHPIKTMTTGEGGAVLTRDEAVAQQCNLLRTHGIKRAASVDTPWLYQQDQLGYNYRLSDIHAALGISQLSRVDDFVARRNHINRQYRQHLSQLELVSSDAGTSSGHLASMLLPKGSDLTSIKQLYEYLKENNIASQKHYIPIHTQPYYKKTKEYYLPKTLEFYQRQISLPNFYELSDEEVSYVIQTINEYLG
jgi:UDP-4-amino-4,6-dideoxy-N-acetyl-beta-L-altrosamine transaminase